MFFKLYSSISLTYTIYHLSYTILCIHYSIYTILYTHYTHTSHLIETKGKAKLLGRDVPTTVEFMNNDLVNVMQKDWRDGDVIFCNSTCFDDILMNKLCDRCCKLVTYMLNIEC